MAVFILSDNKKHLEYWKETVKEAIVIEYNEITVIDENDILIMDKILYKKVFIAKTIILDTVPTFETSQQLLKDGVKAYGNTYMHPSHLISAIQSVKEDKLWIYPDFVAQMIGTENIKDTNLLDTKLKPLSQREKEIAKLILKGLTNKEIAIELRLSANTVKIHTTHIYKKLNVSDRLSLFSFLK